MNSDEQLSFKYFLNVAFVREISPKLSDAKSLTCARYLLFPSTLDGTSTSLYFRNLEIIATKI